MVQNDGQITRSPMRLKVQFGLFMALGVAAPQTLVVWLLGVVVIISMPWYTTEGAIITSVLLAGLALVWVMLIAWSILTNVTIVEDTSNVE